MKARIRIVVKGGIVIDVKRYGPVTVLYAIEDQDALDENGKPETCWGKA